MTSYRTEREEFIARMVSEFRETAPHVVLGFARAIMRRANSVQRHAEAQCNGDTTEAQNRRAASAEAQIVECCQALGCTVKFGGDPRGYCVRLILPSGKGNTWGGDAEGWGVPTP